MNSKKSKNKNKKVLIIMLIILLLALAVGYAAFTDILTISGTANAKGTFDLEFQHAEVVKAVGVNKEETKAEISEDKNILTVNVADLAYPGAGVEFSVDIANVGTIPAKVNAVTAKSITGSEHIKVTGLEIITTNHPTIEAGDYCNIHFTVEWPKEMTEQIAENEIATFELAIEYTQDTGKDFDGEASHIDGEIVPDDKRIANLVTSNDYGKPINYSITVKGQTLDNWKVFYNDGENVYIILGDYLPNTLVPEEAGLEVSNTYSVFSTTDRATLLNGLTTSSYWTEFAKGARGATAVGAPTVDMLMASYNAKHGTALDYTKYPYLDTTDNLYLPQTSIIDDDKCSGYLLASSYVNNANCIWNVYYNGRVYREYYYLESFGIRPVVCLSANTAATVGETVVLQPQQ